MKLLIGMPDKNSWGGPNACEPPFVEALRVQGNHVTEQVYVYGDKKSSTNIFARISRVIRVAFTFRKIVKKNEFDLVHINTSFDLKAVLRDVITVSLLPKKRGKLFLKMHGSDNELLDSNNKIKRMLWKYLLKKIEGIGVLSSEEKDNFVKAGVGQEKIFVVKNVVGVNANSEIDTKKEDIPTILFVSRFIPTKGLIDVIRACSIVKKKGYSFNLKCVGDGPVKAEAEAETKRFSLQNCTEFTGYVSENDVEKFYLTSSFLVFPTYHIEGFPLVIFNAAAAGLPIITTRIRAAADYLSEPENCLWVEAKNPEDIAEKIIKLITDKALCENMSRNNFALAKSFSAEIIAKEYLSIYEKMIGKT